MRHRRIPGRVAAAAAAAAAATATDAADAAVPRAGDSAMRVPPRCLCQRAGVQRRCAELRRLRRQLAVVAAHVRVVVLLLVLLLALLVLVLQWHAHLHLRKTHLHLRKTHLHLRIYHLTRQPVELRVVHRGYLLPRMPSCRGMHPAEAEMAALHLLLLLPHDHRLRLQRVKGAL